jgi:homogentisate 1,2-dioxygenase
MPVYQKVGKLPAKRHTTFRNDSGGLYQEELIGTEGFSGNFTLAYHLYPPTEITKIGDPFSVEPEIAITKNLTPLSFQGFDIQPEKDYIESRKVLMLNDDLKISLAAPTQSFNYFYKNADGDELIFVHEGEGTLQTMFGSIDYVKGDYLLIPRGTVYQLELENENNRFLIIESASPIETPKRYRNAYGQLMEHAPFAQRDLRLPIEMETRDEKGNFPLMIKKHGLIYPFIYNNHPFDLVGWDGYQYPYAFSIFDFEPITGRIHLPPPIHQTFEGNNFVVCSFVPRLYDYHPEAIPAPYHHSNLDSDEVLYYVDGDFMSRNNIQKGQLTLHPAGIPHGPHPGAIERSIGKKSTEEYAVMIDPFRPLQITKEAMKIIVPDYYKSWLPQQHTPVKTPVL